MPLYLPTTMRAAWLVLLLTAAGGWGSTTSCGRVAIVEAFVLPAPPPTISRARTIHTITRRTLLGDASASAMTTKVAMASFDSDPVALMVGGSSVIAAFIALATLRDVSHEATTSGGGGLEKEVQGKETDVLPSQRGPLDEEATTSTTTRGLGVGRRGTLLTLASSAMSFAAGDLMLNAVTTTAGVVATPAAGIYERVIAFGNKYRGTAIASEELLAWVAAQKVATLSPEIQAWIAAQRKLQLVRKFATAATAAVTRAGTATTKAAGAAGGVIEEGFLARAATVTAATAATKAMSTPSNTTTAPTTNSEATEFANDDDDNKDLLSLSSNDKNLTAATNTTLDCAKDDD